jgi:hypothetical protein
MRYQSDTLEHALAEAAEYPPNSMGQDAAKIVCRVVLRESGCPCGELDYPFAALYYHNSTLFDSALECFEPKSRELLYGTILGNWSDIIDEKGTEEAVRLGHKLAKITKEEYTYFTLPKGQVTAFYLELKRAVREDDREAVARMVHFPCYTNYLPRTIRDKDEFLRKYGWIINRGFRKHLLLSDTCDVTNNAVEIDIPGAAFGAGGFCLDDSCKTYELRIGVFNRVHGKPKVAKCP